jgi:hypothetical protein
MRLMNSSGFWLMSKFNNERRIEYLVVLVDNESYL